MTRRRVAAIAFASVFIALTATTARADFSAVVRAIEAKGGRSHSVIPLFGLVRMAVWIAHPEGVHDIELAVWEDRNVAIGAREIEPLLRAKGGADYRPIVASRSRNGEWAFVYARPKGNLLDLLIVAHDTSDTTVVHTVVEPDRLAATVNAHRDHDHHDHGARVNVAWR